MGEYRFPVIVRHAPLTEEQILDAADALGKAGCTDASLRGQVEGMECLFAREAKTLQAAIASAVSQVERAGFRIARLEMERGCIPG